MAMIMLRPDQTMACKPIEVRLDNWGWRMGQARILAETGSKEGDWRSPQRWDYVPTPEPPDDTPGADADALEVDQAVASLPLRYDFMLRAHYVWAAEANAMIRFAKKVGFRRPNMDEVEAALAMGKALLVKQLEIPAVIRKARQREWIGRRIEIEKLRGMVDED